MSTSAEDATNLVDAAAAQTAATAAEAATAAAQAGVATQTANGKLAFSYDDKTVEATFGKADKDGKPENLEAKYWDADKKAIKVDVLFSQDKWKGTKLGKKLEILGAPAEGTEYTITMPKDSEFEFATDDPAVKGFLAIARKHDIAQAFVDEVIGEVAKLTGESRGTNLQAEIAKLGKDGVQRLQNLQQFLGTHMEKPQIASLLGLITSADSFTALEALVKATGAPSFMPRDPDTTTVGASGRMTVEQWNELNFAKDEHGQRKRAVDPKYNAMVEEKAKEVFGETRRDASGHAVTASGQRV